MSWRKILAGVILAPMVSATAALFIAGIISLAEKIITDPSEVLKTIVFLLLGLAIIHLIFWAGDQFSPFPGDDA